MFFTRLVGSLERIAVELARQNDIAEAQCAANTETNELLRKAQESSEKVLLQRAKWEKVEAAHMERCERRYLARIEGHEVTEPVRH